MSMKNGKERKMKTIRDNRIFHDLEKAWMQEKGSPFPDVKYWTAGDKEMNTLWTQLFAGAFLKNMRIPYFAGELDHIEITRKGVYFYDSGCNGRGHSFVIRREK